MLAIALAAIDPVTVGLISLGSGAIIGLATIVASLYNGTRSAFANETKVLNDFLRARITDLERALAECMGRQP